MIGLRNVIGSTGLKNPCMIDSFRLDLGSARNILWKKATQIVIFTSFRCLSSSLLKLLRRRARKRFSTMKFPTWVRQRSVVKVRVEFKKWKWDWKLESESGNKKVRIKADLDSESESRKYRVESESESGNWKVKRAWIKSESKSRNLKVIVRAEISSKSESGIWKVKVKVQIETWELALQSEMGMKKTSCLLTTNAGMKIARQDSGVPWEKKESMSIMSNYHYH